MDSNILIVEDDLIVAKNLKNILERAGYRVCGIARSVPHALDIVRQEKPTLVLLDIFLKGKETGIDLAGRLKEQNIPFIYLSANSNEDVLTLAKKTEPCGFLVKPFREKDLLIAIEIAQYRHDLTLATSAKSETILREQLSRISSGVIWMGEEFTQYDAQDSTLYSLRLCDDRFQYMGQWPYSRPCFCANGFR